MQSQTSEPNLNDTMIALMQTLNNLKMQREKLNDEIENEAVMQNQLQQEINRLKEQYQQISEQLDNKQSVLNVYNKILSESDTAYNKIVQSTQALYAMVKNEEKKFMDKQ